MIQKIKCGLNLHSFVFDASKVVDYDSLYLGRLICSNCHIIRDVVRKGNNNV